MSNETLPDFAGNPVPAICLNCAHCSNEDDSECGSSPWYICEKEGREHVSNLITFPFKKPQACCELHYVHLVDWDAEAKKMEGGK